jgi:acyl-CoA dehydrogenase
MTDSLLTDSVGEIFAAVCTDDALRAAGHDGFAPQAWSAAAEAGLPWISVPEEAGGEGGDLADALAVLRLAGYHGLPLPLAETGVLGGWLLAAAGLQAARVPTTVASGPHLARSAGTVRGTAGHVARGRAAEHVVVLAPAPDGAVVAVFDSVDPLHNLTRRLWAWTREYGTAAQSAGELGAIVAAFGAAALWPAIASGGTTPTPA